eukprot:gene48468-63578_t
MTLKTVSATVSGLCGWKELNIAAAGRRAALPSPSPIVAGREHNGQHAAAERRHARQEAVTGQGVGTGGGEEQPEKEPSWVVAARAAADEDDAR